LAWGFHGLALLVAVGLAVTEWSTGSIRASLVLVAVALVFAAGAWISGQRVHQGIAGAVVVLAVVAAVLRPLDQLSNERYFVIHSAVAAVAVLLTWYAVRVIPGPWSIGARWGATISLLLPGAVAFIWAAALGVQNIGAAIPWWHAAEPKLLDGAYQWELPVSLVLLVGAGALLAPGVARKLAVVAGLVALALAAPGWPPVAAWAAPTIDLVIAAGLLVWALTVPGRFGLAAKSVGALLLIGHALMVGQGSPMRAMLVMTAVVVIGLVVSTAAPRSLFRPGVTIEGRYSLGGIAAGFVDLLLPWLAFTAVAAFGGDQVASWRVLLLVVLAVPLLGTAKLFRGYHVVAGMLIALYPLWPDLPGNESQAVYAAASAVAMTIFGFGGKWAWVRWAPLLPAFVTLLWTGASWYSVLLEPIGNVERIWAGNSQTPHVPMLHAIAVTLLLVPLATLRSVRVIAFAAVIPALMWLAVFEVPWPVIPAVTLLGGLAMVVVATLRGKDPVLGVVGALLILPGLAGALPEKWSTITAFALISVAAVVVATSAKAKEIRILAWLAGAAAKVLLAVSIGQAASLNPDVTAYLVLVAAALLLVIAYTPLSRGAGPAAEAAAHSSAAVALALCNGSPRAAAGVLAIWGVAIGLTALRRQTVPRASIAAALIWFAWILLLQAEKVETLEAYTLPVAVLAIVVGVMAARKRADLSSWLGYGPALGAALLPSLAAVLIQPDQTLRRLLLGAGALAVTIAGAVWRRQAPFLLGGATLLLLAVHELVLVWQMVPAWIPLAIGGLLLVGLAITYEGRLRDLGRLRDAVSRMT
ncbi:MAG TPA: hypothetical protein DGT23_23440, partial [Micromonosporaceae bacterium]|nr:hypothetical protein [Micromonosporaceae bacterium]